MTGTNHNLLSVRGLVVCYPAGVRSRASLTAVRGIDLDIPRAGIYGLVGESGSGKSSLAHAILQLQPVAAGQVLWHGQDLVSMKGSQLRGARKEIQLVFQDPLASLSPRRSVLQTLVEPLDHFRVGQAGRREEKASAALEAVGLSPDLRHRYPRELSGGQRQRVALARALITEPELIIADEPVSSLDVSVQARIIELILELREKMGIAFLFVSHDLAVVGQLADAVGVMHLGEIVEQGTAEDVFARPAHPYTRSLLAAIPVADPDHPRPSVLEGEPPSPLTPPSGCVFHKRCPESITPCSSIVPTETSLDRRNSSTVATQDSQTTDHRVKCHLWNATKN
jgi:oligopeptide/dipeptide ABC transporter ATP-binding protein